MFSECGGARMEGVKVVKDDPNWCSTEECGRRLMNGRVERKGPKLKAWA